MSYWATTRSLLPFRVSTPPLNRAIFAAARHALRVADFINGLQPAPAANS
jgi:hypothetical protein